MATIEKMKELVESNPFIIELLNISNDISEARIKLFEYLYRCDEIQRSSSELHPWEKKLTQSYINVFKNIITINNEIKTNCSCLSLIFKILHRFNSESYMDDVNDSFLVEMIYLFKGVTGEFDFYSRSDESKLNIPGFVNLTGREAALAKAVHLDSIASKYHDFIERNEYKSGLMPDVAKVRMVNKERILDSYSGSNKEWDDYNWHLKNSLQDIYSISKVIDLSEDEKQDIENAFINKMLITITPFYLSLMDKRQEKHMHDRALRTQVIPNKIYLEDMEKHKDSCKDDLDFMLEKDTSPIDLVTRRYPMISIIKPYSWCSQICVYCQRNWELNQEQEDYTQWKENLDKAFEWFEANPTISEILVTGGDPLILNNEDVDYILNRLSKIKHIKRIRIGTRTLVTMPMRFDNQLLNILRKYHNPPIRIITIVTHVQHSYEISTEMAKVAYNINRMGIRILNQQVFTIQNCRKFETSFLRETLISIGITPYYLFNLKDKSETDYFRVPIARLLQEQEEEARILPGQVRTDKPIFNIPAQGKNKVDSCQDHEIVMIDSQGHRIYEFFPWEKFSVPLDTYLYKDEPIYRFLKKLEELGENLDDYKTIWHYF